MGCSRPQAAIHCSMAPPCLPNPRALQSFAEYNEVHHPEARNLYHLLHMAM